jgi:NAD(P)-dependent dehydrogenase (short-subunit alcohol dehydrogenase family)
MEVCLRVLQRVADSSGTIPRDVRFNTLISKIYREGKRHDLRREKEQQRAEDRDLLEATAMVQIQRDAIPAQAAIAPAQVSTRRLNKPECCYICKSEYTEVHFFYHLMCPACAELNYRMRTLRADLRGRTALITGGRVKIGFQTVLRLLRDGAKVIVTTRFPHSAAARFHEVADSAEWHDRLRIHGLDLRNIPVVEEFAAHLLETEPAIDILIHNAAQTIKRPRGFYAELVAQEQNPDRLAIEARELVEGGAPSTLAVADSSALLPAVMPDVKDVLPANALHDNEERADSRDMNSWLLRLEEVSAPEMLEVQLVNAIAPFILNARLKKLMVRSPFERRFIVNVSAMEGQFGRHKTIYHPHTNMAKAALNMMTCTSAADYARDSIYMNSVDTGWVTDENPTPKRLRKQEERGFFAPLDIEDGAARIYHPVAVGVTEPDEPVWGKFLKDYGECRW